MFQAQSKSVNKNSSTKTETQTEPKCKSRPNKNQSNHSYVRKTNNRKWFGFEPSKFGDLKITIYRINLHLPPIHKYYFERQKCGNPKNISKPIARH